MEKEKPFVYIDTNFSLSEMLMLKLAFNSNESSSFSKATSEYLISKAVLINLSASSGFLASKDPWKYVQ